jgi:2-polyprenyl-6-methoxyphenol hydroxylase-like FAD-dependent oxidoreductase
MTSDVLVMGGGATGQLAAAYLRKRIPNLKVAVIEGRRENRPIVGESLVGVSVDFMLELGLGAYLVEKHYPKYGLTYYFKPDIDNPRTALTLSTRFRLRRRYSPSRSTDSHSIVRCGTAT